MEEEVDYSSDHELVTGNEVEDEVTLLKRENDLIKEKLKRLEQLESLELARNAAAVPVQESPIDSVHSFPTTEAVADIDDANLKKSLDKLEEEGDSAECNTHENADFEPTAGSTNADPPAEASKIELEEVAAVLQEGPLLILADSVSSHADSGALVHTSLPETVHEPASATPGAAEPVLGQIEPLFSSPLAMFTATAAEDEKVCIGASLADTTTDLTAENPVLEHAEAAEPMEVEVEPVVSTPSVAVDFVGTESVVEVVSGDGVHRSEIGGGASQAEPSQPVLLPTEHGDGQGESVPDTKIASDAPSEAHIPTEPEPEPEPSKPSSPSPPPPPPEETVTEPPQESTSFAPPAPVAPPAAPLALQPPQPQESPLYTSASATSPPFEVDQALIARAKANAARREGLTNVCDGFVQGTCADASVCGLSHDAVPATHCPAYNSQGQYFDEYCPFEHAIADPPATVAVVVIAGSGTGRGSGCANGGKVSVSGGGGEDGELGERGGHVKSGADGDSVKSATEMEVVDHTTISPIVDATIDSTTTTTVPTTDHTTLTPVTDDAKDTTAPLTTPSTPRITTTEVGGGLKVTIPNIPCPSVDLTADSPPTVDLTTAAGSDSHSTTTTTPATTPSNSAATTPTGSSKGRSRVVTIVNAPSGGNGGSVFGRMLESYQHRHGADTSIATATTTISANTNTTSSPDGIASLKRKSPPSSIEPTTTHADPITTATTSNTADHKMQGSGEEVRKRGRFDEKDGSGGRSGTGGGDAGGGGRGSGGGGGVSGSGGDGYSGYSGGGGSSGGGGGGSGGGGGGGGDSSFTGARKPGVCYNFQHGTCERGDSCAFLHEKRDFGVCFSFQKGACQNGDGCRFRHDLDSNYSNVCFDLKLKGHCARGESCRFSHDFPGATAVGNSVHSAAGGGAGGGASNVCFSFCKGHCDRGDSCRFYHDPAVVAVLAGGGEVCSKFIRGECGRGDGCRYQHVGTGTGTGTMHRPAQEVCRAFQRGHCQYGDNCRHLHQEHGSGVGGGGMSVGATGSVSSVSGGGGSTRGPCYNYQRGACELGDACRFSHDGPPGTAGVCRAFQRGECSRGDSCRYKHEIELCRAFLNNHCTRGDTCHYSHGQAPASPAQRQAPPAERYDDRYGDQNKGWERDGRGRGEERGGGDRGGGDRGGDVWQKNKYGAESKDRSRSRDRVSFHRDQGPFTDPRDPRDAPVDRDRERDRVRDRERVGDRERYINTSTFSPAKAAQDYKPPRDPSRDRDNRDIRDNRGDHGDWGHDWDRRGGDGSRVQHHSGGGGGGGGGWERDRADRADRADRGDQSRDRSPQRDPPRLSVPPLPIPALDPSQEVFGYADQETQRRARENEDRRSRIVNPCASAYRGNCANGDQCNFSHDVVPFGYCRLFNNTGRCLKAGCPHVHELFKYVPPGSSDTRNVRSSPAHSHRRRSPSSSPSPPRSRPGGAQGSAMGKYPVKGGNRSPSRSRSPPPGHGGARGPSYQDHRQGHDQGYSQGYVQQSQSQGQGQGQGQKRRRSRSPSASPPPAQRRYNQGPYQSQGQGQGYHDHQSYSQGGQGGGQGGGAGAQQYGYSRY